jgi:hypothetical protein
LVSVTAGPRAIPAASRGLRAIVAPFETPPGADSPTEAVIAATSDPSSVGVTEMSV